MVILDSGSEVTARAVPNQRQSDWQQASRRGWRLMEHLRLTDNSSWLSKQEQVQNLLLDRRARNVRETPKASTCLARCAALSAECYLQQDPFVSSPLSCAEAGFLFETQCHNTQNIYRPCNRIICAKIIPSKIDLYRMMRFGINKVKGTRESPGSRLALTPLFG
jgi:hypothetical protein